MFTRQDYIDSVNHEVAVIKHLHSKVPPGKLELPPHREAALASGIAGVHSLQSGGDRQAPALRRFQRRQGNVRCRERIRARRFSRHHGPRSQRVHHDRSSHTRSRLCHARSAHADGHHGEARIRFGELEPEVSYGVQDAAVFVSKTMRSQRDQHIQLLARNGRASEKSITIFSCDCPRRARASLHFHISLPTQATRLNISLVRRFLLRSSVFSTALAARSMAWPIDI